MLTLGVLPARYLSGVVAAQHVPEVLDASRRGEAAASATADAAADAAAGGVVVAVGFFEAPVLVLVGGDGGTRAVVARELEARLQVFCSHHYFHRFKNVRAEVLRVFHEVHGAGG